MVFHIANYVYLPFWWAIWNAVTYWRALEMSNQWGPHRVMQNYWVIKFIRKLPMIGRWREVVVTLRQWMLHIEVYTPFSYRGLVEFLSLVEHQVDHLGVTPLQRSAVAS